MFFFLEKKEQKSEIRELEKKLISLNKELVNTYKYQLKDSLSLNKCKVEHKSYYESFVEVYN